jgi:multiple sugar transport system substrate-binding protein
MNKKWMRLLVVLMVFALAACSGGGGGGTPAPDAASPQPAGSDKPKEPVTIKYFNWDTDQDRIKSIIADFEKENPGIKVTSEVLVKGGSANDNVTKLDVLMATNESVDVVAFPNIEQTVLRAANGMFLPLDDFMKKDNIKAQDEYLVTANYGGKVFGLPQIVNYWYVIMNEDHLKEAGLKVPEVGWTWDEYREYAKKLTKGEGQTKRYGSYFHSWGEYANPMLYSEKAHPYMVDLKTPIFNDASFDYWFELRRAMEQDDKTAKSLSDVIGAKLNYRTEFFNQQASMMIIGSWTIVDVGNTAQYPHEFKTAFAPMPRMNAQSKIGGTNIAGEFLAISKNTKHPEESYKFLRYLSTKGSEVRGTSGWKKSDGDKVITNLTKNNDKLYNLESLKHTLFNDKVHSPLSGEFEIAYGNEMKKNVLEAGFSKFLLDKTSAAEAKKWMMDEANKIVQKNSK